MTQTAVFLNKSRIKKRINKSSFLDDINCLALSINALTIHP